MAGMSTFYVCYGIVKGKMPVKSVWPIHAKDYESAIRQIKRSAAGNFSMKMKPATLFYETGIVIGWCFYNEGKYVYLDRFDMENIGLVPKRGM